MFWHLNSVHANLRVQISANYNGLFYPFFGLFLLCVNFRTSCCWTCWINNVCPSLSSQALIFNVAGENQLNDLVPVETCSDKEGLPVSVGSTSFIAFETSTCGLWGVDFFGYRIFWRICWKYTSKWHKYIDL